MMNPTLHEQKLARESLIANAQPNNIGWGEMVVLSMNVVEQIAVKNPEMRGDEKLTKAKQLIPTIIQTAREIGYVSPNLAIELQHYATLSVDVLDSLINAFHFIKGHPNYIQFQEQIVSKCCTPNFCRRKKQ